MTRTSNLPGPVGFHECRVETRLGPRPALVVTPATTVVIDRQRLFALRHDPAESAIDQALLREVRAREGRARVLLYRGRNDDGSATWGFDDELTDAEARELGYFLIKSQVPSYRHLIARGVLVLMHVDLGFREVDALRQGTAAVLAELERRSNPNHNLESAAAAVIRADIWILKHLTFFFSLGLAKAVEETLPGVLPMLEQREAHVRGLVDKLPPGLI